MLIEVKTTNGWERTPFHISRNELAVADENRDFGIYIASGILYGISVKHSQLGRLCKHMSL